jgi:hypothetical protein
LEALAECERDLEAAGDHLLDAPERDRPKLLAGLMETPRKAARRAPQLFLSFHQRGHHGASPTADNR